MQKQRLADALEKVVFSDGQQLFPKNRPTDRCYLLRSGAVQLTAADGSVSRLTDGACIGERALVAGDNRCRPNTGLRISQILSLPCVLSERTFVQGNELLIALCEDAFIVHRLQKAA